MSATARGLNAVFKTYFDIHDLCSCQITILIVMDGKCLGFDDAIGFHLGNVLKILAVDSWSHVHFEIKKAHRQASTEPDVFPLFRFDTNDLTQYDQIWLFGMERQFGGLDPLSQQELKSLSKFMEDGGGVFAAGDHENLGFAMCGEVPRVRSMRRWHYERFPTGAPQSPSESEKDRHDTLVGSRGDQSDAVPQRIYPRFYTRTLNSGILQLVLKYPHPVLCGSGGVVEYLPDHMHEGLCEVPADLAQSFTFEEFAITEYPTVDGHQEIPEVIAWAESQGSTKFGALATYDGHRVGRGRVLVDSTWHHWFNINLQGFLKAVDPQDPTYDPNVISKWEGMKSYYRNVGLWLARPRKQQRVRRGAWLLMTRSFDIMITHQDISMVRDPLLYYWQLGSFARAALGRFTSHCQTVRWIVDLLPWLETSLDPWAPISLRSQQDSAPWIDGEQLELVALGGGVDALLTAFKKEQEEEGVQATLNQREDEIEKIARRGAARAVSGLIQRNRERADNLALLEKIAAERMTADL